ncbi:hypothetical protein LIER_35132 [Lithospermum erythrorhizon]|uniref:DUF4218 domain-containing protein n=1 Tax=Lithospermum erythrorhizon TaxID=34254 RepID=A0AAV3NK91_LITER
MNVIHSTWPVVLMLYNLPLWLCLKKSFFILSILINGSKSPGNKIDVYMQPLIEDLKELCSSGVKTYNDSSKCSFELRAALLWTISDYPGYEYLSGWGTKSQFSCPYCGNNIRSFWLDNGRKFCYTGHRFFLPIGHPMRRDTVSFNGKMEFGKQPLSVSGNEFLNQSDGILTEYKKEDAKLRGAVQFCWMYLIKRYLMTLKKYVRNQAHPEGSIAKEYLIEECMNFCSQYLGCNEGVDYDQSQYFDAQSIEPKGKGSEALRVAYALQINKSCRKSVSPDAMAFGNDFCTLLL